MMRPLLRLGLLAVALTVSSSAQLATSPALSAEWRETVATAAAVVAHETPDARLPFRPAVSGGSDRKVFAHYFPPFPISFDAAPADRDYYAIRLPTGAEPESAAIKRFGVWQRPLPTGPWPAERSFATNYAIDVMRAARIGVDGFGIDLIHINSGLYWDWALTLLDAAAASVPGFGIVPEPDVAALGDVGVPALADALGRFYRHPAGYRLPDGRLLVIPFRPELKPIAFWRELVAEMARRDTPIAFIPDTLAVDDALPYAPISVGLSFWGGRDPASAAAQLGAARRLATATGLPVMMPVAPQDFRPKNALFWEARNTEAFRAQWIAAIEAGTPYVHLITWNDFSEATEVSPGSTTQFLFYDLAAYYIAWYKARRPPPIERDALFYAFRRQLFDPGRSDIGAAYKRLGSTPAANDVELIGFLRAPGSLEIRLGGQVRRVAAGEGLRTLRMPARPGTPCFRLTSGATAIAFAAPVGIEALPRFKDAIYGGGSSLRPYVATVAVPPGAEARPMPARAAGRTACG